jgi:hypothetical protein
MLLASGFGGLGHKTICWQLYGFLPQNPNGGSKVEWMARGGIEEFAYSRSYVTRGMVAVG